MRRHSVAVMVLALALSTGWTSCGDKTPPPPPEVVYVPVEKIVAVPKELTVPCPVTRAKERTVEAVVAAYNRNVPVLEDCDKRMARIRKLAPPD